MPDYKDVIVRLPLAYYRELEHIAEVNIIHPTTMAEKALIGFIDEMRKHIYPPLSDLNKESECQPTNTDVKVVEPSSTLPDQ